MESNFDLNKSVEYLLEKERDEKRAQADLLAQARSDFAKIVSEIVQRYAPLRIYQWGSLISGERFKHGSDIDIAVEGVSGKDFPVLCDRAEEMSEIPLHIMPYEICDAVTRMRIRKYGRVVYDRENKRVD